MDIVLVPGMWLDGSSWDAVVPVLQKAGHTPHALTLPGLESRSADRSGITLRDHVDAVVRAIDAAGPSKVLLVGHSAGAAIAYAALDARTDRVERLVLVGGFPTADGDALVQGYRAEHGEIPLPDWSEFDDADLVGLDEGAREAFRRRAIPFPEQVVNGPQRVSDPRRYDVPVTVICTEFRSQQLRSWIESEQPMVREFSNLRHLDLVDLPTGHWPQFTRPVDLANLIALAART